MAVDMFLKIEGIPGESQDDKHKDWIEVESFSWGLSNTPRGAGGGGGAGKVSLQDLRFVQAVDKATPLLMRAACSGKHFPDAVLSVRKAGERQQDYLKYKLSDILISGLQIGGDGEHPVVEVSLQWQKVTTSYLDASGKEETASTCGGR
jgi:type VI secretion system secreted protein Hcp